MSAYRVTLTAAELDVVRLALGRMLDPVEVKTRSPRVVKPKAAPRVKPPTLARGQFDKVTNRWAKAVANPAKWHAALVGNAATSTGRSSERDVLKAWGLLAA